GPAGRRRRLRGLGHGFAALTATDGPARADPVPAPGAGPTRSTRRVPGRAAVAGAPGPARGPAAAPDRALPGEVPWGTRAAAAGAAGGGHPALPPHLRRLRSRPRGPRGDGARH